jgi:hypothetical protein
LPSFPYKAAAFHDKPSRFIAWRLFVSLPFVIVSLLPSEPSSTEKAAFAQLA